MNWQLAVIVIAVVLAVVFVLWRMLATFRRSNCADCNGNKHA